MERIVAPIPTYSSVRKADILPYFNGQFIQCSRVELHVHFSAGLLLWSYWLIPLLHLHCCKCPQTFINLKIANFSALCSLYVFTYWRLVFRPSERLPFSRHDSESWPPLSSFLPDPAKLLSYSMRHAFLAGRHSPPRRCDIQIESNLLNPICLLILLKPLLNRPCVF